MNYQTLLSSKEYEKEVSNLPFVVKFFNKNLLIVFGSFFGCIIVASFVFALLLDSENPIYIILAVSYVVLTTYLSAFWFSFFIHNKKIATLKEHVQSYFDFCEGEEVKKVIGLVASEEKYECVHSSNGKIWVKDSHGNQTLYQASDVVPFDFPIYTEKEAEVNGYWFF